MLTRGADRDLSFSNLNIAVWFNLFYTDHVTDVHFIYLFIF